MSKVREELEVTRKFPGAAEGTLKINKQVQMLPTVTLKKGKETISS